MSGVSEGVAVTNGSEINNRWREAGETRTRLLAMEWLAHTPMVGLRIPLPCLIMRCGYGRGNGQIFRGEGFSKHTKRRIFPTEKKTGHR